ncbi:MAG: nucleotidyltransferase [Vicinamibacteria bacterium]|nr:nucleotidyltransferase [Vicinamibacteria bacterium]
MRRTRVLPFVHVATAMPLDVVLAGSGLEDEFLDRARDVDMGGTIVPLIDPEDLIIAKILAGRPKDIEDAHGIWRLRGPSLDASRIRHTLQLLEEALSQGDLLTGFELIRRRVEVADPSYRSTPPRTPGHTSSITDHRRRPTPITTVPDMIPRWTSLHLKPPSSSHATWSRLRLALDSHASGRRTCGG